MSKWKPIFPEPEIDKAAEIVADLNNNHADMNLALVITTIFGIQALTNDLKNVDHYLARLRRMRGTLLDCVAAQAQRNSQSMSLEGGA